MANGGIEVFVVESIASVSLDADAEILRLASESEKDSQRCATGLGVLVKFTPPL